MTRDLKRVVVTGMGVITPLGNTLDEFWKNIAAGRSGADYITKFDTASFKTKFAAEVKEFNPSAYFEKNEVRKYDLFTQYAVAASEEAIKQAGLNFDSLNKNKIGVIWGSGNGGILTFQDQLEEFFKGNKNPRFNPYFIPKIIADIPSGVISIRHGLRGLNFSTISACASSTTAVIDAFNYIRLGKADIIIAGGSEAAINESGIGGFNAARALSTHNENPKSASRPFDVNRDGFVMGEGGGALIVESLDSALARGANIIAEIAGGGMAADAYHLTGTHPDGEGAYLGMMDALEDAAIDADKIDYVNAHATSTLLGDESELKAIFRVFGERKSLNISGTKSMTGHLLGAAGAIEAIITVKSIQENIVPPTINTSEVDPEWKDKFNFTLGTAQLKEINFAMSNTFGFGGHIATVVFEKVYMKLKIDILAFGAHPDDVECAAAGVLLKHISTGKTAAIVDLTAGEMGSYGTTENRKKESEAAAEILGVQYREQLGLPDGGIENNEANRIRIIQAIRKYRPEIVLCNAIHDRHPDHANAAKLVADAAFLSGLKMKESFYNDVQQQHWRPRAVYHYIQDYFIEPGFVVDITKYMEKKFEAILAFSSQFTEPRESEPNSITRLLDQIRNMSSIYGRPINASYAEGFTTARYIGVDDMFHLV